MRITSNAIQRETLAALRNGMAGLAEAQRRVSTGLRVHRPSDDPVAAAGILRTGGGLRALDQYGRNIDTAESRLREEEQALDTLTNLLSRAKELATGTLSVSADASVLESAKREVEGLLDVAIEQANLRHGSGYLFGGLTPDVQPFQDRRADVPLTDPPSVDRFRAAGAEPAGAHRVDIGGSDWFATNHDGAEVFEETGVFEALDGLSRALDSGDTMEIAGAMNGLDSAFSGVQQRLSEVGARTNRLEVARANVEALDLTLQTLRSDLQDADMEEAVSDLIGRQIAYQSALLATSKIMSTTLTDYLR